MVWSSTLQKFSKVSSLKILRCKVPIRLTFENEFYSCSACWCARLRAGLVQGVESCVCVESCVWWYVPYRVIWVIQHIWYVLYDAGWCVLICVGWYVLYDVGWCVMVRCRWGYPRHSATQHATTRVAVHCSATCSSTLQHKIVAQSFQSIVSMVVAKHFNIL